MEKIFENIKKSNLTNDQKELLIEYSINLNKGNLPIIFDVEQIKLLFGIETPIDEFMKESTSFHTIKKYNGDLREIYVPNDHLKEIQRWIVDEILYKCKVSNYTCSYVKNKSILNHAKTHIHLIDSWLITYDIVDFFPSIKKESIENIFFNIGYNREVARALALLCSIEGELAQGFPTSPVLSNIYFENIDNVIATFCLENNMKYSRYADDLAFSGEGFEIPEKLKEELNSFLKSILIKSGLIINQKKTKVFTNNQVKKLTGILIINNELKIPSKVKRFLSKEIYYCKKYGVEDHLIKTERINLANYKGYLYGIAGYIRMVEPKIGQQFFEDLSAIYWG